MLRVAARIHHTPVSFAKTTTVMRAATRFVLFQKKHAKKEPEWRRRKESRTRSSCTEMWPSEAPGRPCTPRRASCVPGHPVHARLCRGCGATPVSTDCSLPSFYQSCALTGRLRAWHPDTSDVLKDMRKRRPAWQTWRPWTGCQWPRSGPPDTAPRHWTVLLTEQNSPSNQPRPSSLPSLSPGPGQLPGHGHAESVSYIRRSTPIVRLANANLLASEEFQRGSGSGRGWAPIFLWPPGAARVGGRGHSCPAVWE